MQLHADYLKFYQKTHFEWLQSHGFIYIHMFFVFNHLKVWPDLVEKFLDHAISYVISHFFTCATTLETSNVLSIYL